MESTLVLDNGGYSLKLGFASSESPMIMRNCLVKTKKTGRLFIGDEWEKEGIDGLGLQFRSPVERGVCTNWEQQILIWDRAFSSTNGISLTNPANCSLLLTCPSLIPPVLSSAVDEIVFEHYNFKAMYRNSASSLANFYAQSSPASLCNKTTAKASSFVPASLVIDVGYSSTLITPIFEGKEISSGITRINVGGKIITNYLKQIVSMKHVDMMEETNIMNKMKEDVCFVANDFMKRLKESKMSKSDLIYYVLPDFVNIKEGYIKTEGTVKSENTNQTNPTGGSVKVKLEPDQNNKEGGIKPKEKPDEQVIPLKNERFCAPEALFSPSDCGFNQAGIPESIIQCLNSVSPLLHEPLLENVVIFGGSSQMPGLLERVEKDLRSMIVDDYSLNVNSFEGKDIEIAPWKGGKLLSQSEHYSSLLFTKKEYEEEGSNGSRRRFN